MPQVCHKHCPPEGGGLLLLLAVIAALVLAAAAAARQAARVLAELIPWACGAVIAVIASAWLGYAASSALREHRRRAERVTAVSSHPPARARQERSS